MTGTDLVELFCSDQVRRWRAGERIPSETYLGLYPTLTHEMSEDFELVYGEFVLRESLGESPSPEEFYWRFPNLSNRFRRQLKLHEALRTELELAERTDRGGPLEDGASSNSTIASPGEGRAGQERSSHDSSTQLGEWPRVSDYEILGELGRGGMGIVYKARQLSLKRIVALKILRAGVYADPEAAARFRSEAEAAARFQHANIIQVYEVGEQEGMGFIALEYVAGGSLLPRLVGTTIDPRESATMIEELSRAIHYAHQRGIVHRDLKPGNILLGDHGLLKITDFGLAKLLECEDGPTRTGAIMVTPCYMAPEQAMGTQGSITPATDVYALGVILYEMMTGRPPFKGATPFSTLEQVSSQEPIWPSKFQRHTPRDLETICLRCLEKEPRKRFGTALELAEDLRRFLDGCAIVSRPVPAWERLWKWAQRRPSLAIGASSAAAATLLLIGGVLYYNTRLRAAVRTAQRAELSAKANARAALEQRNLALKAFNRLIFDVQESMGDSPTTRPFAAEPPQHSHRRPR